MERGKFVPHQLTSTEARLATLCVVALSLQRASAGAGLHELLVSPGIGVIRESFLVDQGEAAVEPAGGRALAPSMLVHTTIEIVGESHVDRPVLTVSRIPKSFPCPFLPVHKNGASEGTAWNAASSFLDS